MKQLPSLRYRLLILTGMLAGAFSLGPTSPIFSYSAEAQTNAPAAAGVTEKDKDTGKPIITTPSGLKYVDVVVGTGAAVKTGDHISVNYTGKLLDGTKFDSSYDRGQPLPLVLGVGQVIKGWDEGLSTMKVGGKRKLIIPPQLGYGNQGAGDAIPPNATLIFDVELVSVDNSK
jgi:peptidylprolyl isomerase